MAGQKCPPKTLSFWQTPLFWLALAVVAALAAGAVAISRARLIAHTRGLLGLSSKLDPSIGRFAASDMSLDGPVIGLRTRLDLQETRDG